MILSILRLLFFGPFLALGYTNECQAYGQKACRKSSYDACPSESSCSSLTCSSHAGRLAYHYKKNTISVCKGPAGGEYKAMGCCGSKVNLYENDVYYTNLLQQSITVNITFSALNWLGGEISSKKGTLTCPCVYKTKHKNVNSSVVITRSDFGLCEGEYIQ